MVEISVRQFEEEDLDRYIEMSKIEYGEQPTTSNLEHIRWKHLESPFGPSLYAALIQDGKVSGRALIQPRTLEHKKEKIQAGSVMDVLLDPSCRTTPSHFINLTKACDLESGILFHTANERTNLLYKKLFKFPSPFALKAYCFPTRLTGFLKKLTNKNLSILECLISPYRWILAVLSKIFSKFTKIKISSNSIKADEIKELNERINKQDGKMLTRSKEFIEWRYIDAPLWKAEVLRVDVGSQFYGYLVIRKIGLDDLEYLVLMDYLIEPQISIYKKMALKLWLIKKTIETKADGFFTMCNPLSPIASVCIGFPFVPIPDKYLPHTTPIFIRTKYKDLKMYETSKTMHITLGDLDYF